MNRFNSIIFLFLVVSASADILTLTEPSQEMPEGKTVVWSPLFQATWDKMNDNIGGKPVKIEPPNALMTKLDSFSFEANKIMPDGGWKTWSGPADKDFLKLVNTEAAQLTGEPHGPFKLGEHVQGSIAAFGLLNREVAFEKAFHKSLKVPLRFGDGKTAVTFFGSKGEISAEYEKTVRVLAYRPNDRSYSLEVSCKQMDDKVIIYMPPKIQNFDTACKWIREWRKTFDADDEFTNQWNDRYLHEEDEVAIPYVSLDAQANFAKDLVGGRFYGKPGDPWIVGDAIQITKFDLYEKGARVRVEASAIADPFGSSMPEPTPRKFIYDRPFFVFLWRENAEWPYLGVWVGDDSVLRKFN